MLKPDSLLEKTCILTLTLFIADSCLTSKYLKSRMQVLFVNEQLVIDALINLFCNVYSFTKKNEKFFRFASIYARPSL